MNCVTELPFCCSVSHIARKTKPSAAVLSDFCDCNTDEWGENRVAVAMLQGQAHHRCDNNKSSNSSRLLTAADLEPIYHWLTHPRCSVPVLGALRVAAKIAAAAADLPHHDHESHVTDIRNSIDSHGQFR